MKKKITKVLTVIFGAILALASFGGLAGCGPSNKTAKRLVIMSEELNGLFNPFFYTAGADGDVVGQTQIGMLSTDEEGKLAYGNDEPVAVLDYKTEKVGDTTEYYFVLKNGLKFSDGKPLTMNDVMFNLYVYLDPAYTGSNTMYSTDIVGLQNYRMQKNISGDGTSEDADISSAASAAADDRIQELITIFHDAGRTTSQNVYDADEKTMLAAIAQHNPSKGYTDAIGETEVSKARDQLKADYQFALESFREELENDYNSAKDSYKDNSPYKETGEFNDEITSFMYMEGYVTITYARKADGKFDTNKIEKVERNYDYDSIKTMQAAIDDVYTTKISSELDNILRYWGTANTMLTEFVSKAKEVLLHKNLSGNQLAYPTITGITSLGHQAATKGSELTVGSKTYKIASAHNADGTVAVEDTYDVLKIVINGVDPKAIWNFGFTVAPYHYYSDPDKYTVDIENNKFGVKWSTFDFMKNVIQGKNYYGVSKNKVPLGAGPYVATDSSYGDKPGDNGFYNNKVVYFKGNKNFMFGAPKIDKLCYQVISSSNSLGLLESGSVHFITPQLTPENLTKLNGMKDKGFEAPTTWQLGYGYIGINAGKVTNINLRKAIMSAMDTKRAINYYSSGTAAQIYWPMSLVGWAYPRQQGKEYDPANPLLNKEDNNNHSYTQFTTDEAAKAKIRSFMSAAGAAAGDSRLKLKFTIAGSNLTEHPTYLTFQHAADLLNDCGWEVEVQPDINALTKLSTGSLTVWAAAWGSTIDPDMYQVYHKNSSATSVLAWGYREILKTQKTGDTEYDILTRLSTKIDAARAITDEAERAAIYKEAMGDVLDLAVEMPCYQRQVVYAYNAKVIDKNTLPATINPYTSPLARIWEVDFVK